MRIGIMSFAHLHAESYIHNLKSIVGVEVIGFSDTDPVRGDRASREYESRWFPEHEALLAERPDAVLICSENANHRELVELAAAAGVHVLCEKPIEVSCESARAMREVCDRAGVHFMTAFPMRFDVNIRAAREVMARGELGEVYAINGVNHSENPYRHRAWFAQQALAGGGAVMDHTVHLLDLYRWFLGSEVVEVYAEVGNPFYPDEIDVDSAGLVTLTFETGVFASIDCSWSRPTSYPRFGHLKMELFGDRGALSVDAFAQHLRVWSGALERTPSWIGWGDNPDLAMIKAFVASVREDREPPVTWRDGYEALRVALACYQSAERGEPVALGSPPEGEG
ncbi:MAG: Gfo/Idh/MocA family oxidoreductase [Truepera sp.]|nr:Gfo/Idh/MocA family oxidoreductase [Truepera sp.]